MTELELDITALKYSKVESSNDEPSEHLPTDWEVFLILRDFLQPRSRISTDEAVEKIIAIFPNGYSDLQSINDVCLELTEQIPYNHPSQLKLARLLWLIGRDQTRITRSRLQDKSAACDAFYQHLAEDVTDNNSSPENDDVTPGRYVNYQAFLANLMDAGLWLPSPHGAMVAMRRVFEQGHESKSLGIREAYILGAAQWILWSGQGLFKLLLWPPDTQLQREERFTRKTWQDWKLGFRKISRSVKYGEECKLVATQTAELMHAIEMACHPTT